MKRVQSTTKVHLAIPDDLYNFYTNLASAELEDEYTDVNESSLPRMRARLMLNVLYYGMERYEEIG